MAASLTVKPASREELEAFVSQNKRWLPDDAEQVLRGMSAIDQRRVISAGTMSSVRDPSAIIQARVRKAREMEAQVGRGASGVIAAANLDPESRISKPAGKEEVEAFIKGNERWLQGEAAEILRTMNPLDQKRVLAAGTLSGCRDPVAVIQTRVKKARQMELELENISAGQRSGSAETSTPPAPTFDPVAAAMFLYAPPSLVNHQESKFAPPPAFYRDTLEVTAGESRGVGGVVEILKAKYGCGKGQRLRVIGETAVLVQFEGGKTAPQNHEGTGWRWVVREEEEAAKAEDAKVRAAKQAAEAEMMQPEIIAAAAAAAETVPQKEAEEGAGTAAANEAAAAEETQPEEKEVVEEKAKAKSKSRSKSKSKSAKKSSSSSSSSSSAARRKKRKAPKKGAKGKDAERKKEKRERSSDASADEEQEKGKKRKKQGKSSSSSSSSSAAKRRRKKGGSSSSSDSSSSRKKRRKGKAKEKKKAASRKSSSSGDSDKEIEDRKAEKEKAASKAKAEKKSQKAKAKRKEAQKKAKAKKTKKKNNAASSTSSS